MTQITLSEAEQVVLGNVKFINLILEEVRKRNKENEALLGMSYGKIVGVGTVYEEAICALRKVKSELDNYLNLVRHEVQRTYGHNSSSL